MQTITTIGLDIAKSVFQVHGVDRSNRRAGNDRADARNSHQLPTAHVAACQVFDLIRYPFDARIEIFPVVDNVSENPDHTGR